MRRVALLRRFSQKKLIKTLKRLRPVALGWDSVPFLQSRRSRLFLSEDDDLPLSNQREVPQIVIADTMLSESSGVMKLPEVVFPLSTLQVNTAYSLLRTLRWRSRYHGGVGSVTTRR